MARTMPPEVNRQIQELIKGIDGMRIGLEFAHPDCKPVLWSTIMKMLKELEGEYAKLQEEHSAP